MKTLDHMADNYFRWGWFVAPVVIGGLCASLRDLRGSRYTRSNWFPVIASWVVGVFFLCVKWSR